MERGTGTGHMRPIPDVILGFGEQQEVCAKRGICARAIPRQRKSALLVEAEISDVHVRFPVLRVARNTESDREDDLEQH
jgi:hypothetical protein